MYWIIGNICRCINIPIKYRSKHTGHDITHLLRAASNYRVSVYIPQVAIAIITINTHIHT